MMDAGERELLAQTVRGALTAPANAASAPVEPDADAVLAQLGWLEMLATEPDDAVAIVFHSLGATNAAATALDDVVLSALGIQRRSDLAVVLPRYGSWDPPARIDGAVVRVEGLATARAGGATGFVAVCATPTGPQSLTIPAADAHARAVHGIDPTARVHSVSARGPDADLSPLDLSGWDSAVASAQRAIAYEIAGANRTMLDLARIHATERVQFGRPVASFQAVRHRLAEALVAIEALDATLAAARDDPSPLTASLAKATAGRTARTVAAHCQQVLAGIGFTTDHPFHRHLKRTMLLEGLFGSADEIALDVGRQLLSTRRVPTLIEL